MWGQYLLDPSRSWSDGVRTYPHGPSTEGVAALEHRHRVHDALVEHLPSLRPVLDFVWVYTDWDNSLSKHQQQSCVLRAYAARHGLMWNVRYPMLFAPRPPPTQEGADSYYVYSDFDEGSHGADSDSYDDVGPQTALRSVNEEDYNDVHTPCTVYRCDAGVYDRLYRCDAAMYGRCGHSVPTEYRSSLPWFDGHHTHASGPTREDVAALESRHDLAQLLARFYRDAPSSESNLS